MEGDKERKIEREGKEENKRVYLMMGKKTKGAGKETKRKEERKQRGAGGWGGAAHTVGMSYESPYESGPCSLRTPNIRIVCQGTVAIMERTHNY